MAAFDDSADPALGAACNRLAAWVEPLPAGAIIDPASGLRESDLALILRHLHATRHGDAPVPTSPPAPAPAATATASVPMTARRR